MPNFEGLKAYKFRPEEVVNGDTSVPFSLHIKLDPFIYSQTKPLDLEWKRRYERIRPKYKESKRRCKELEAKLALLDALENDSERKIRLGPGVRILESTLEKVHSISDTPENLARNLFQAVFTNQELIGKSLTGGTSAFPVPSIDSKKKDAVIGYVMKQHTGKRVTKKGKKFEVDKNSLLSSIKNTLIERIRYVNKREKSRLERLNI